MGNKAPSLENIHGAETQQLFKENKLSIGFVSWEDNGRDKNSSWGPVISDVSLAVKNQSFPIIRPGSNYVDPTMDMDIDKFKVHVGNQKKSRSTNKPMKCISLKDYLLHIDQYVDWQITGNLGLYNKRDEKILTSAQCCILPLVDGQVEFNVQIHNYQADVKNPRVLCLVVSPHGTSAQLLTKRNQPIYFNNRGRKASYVARRLQDTRKEKGFPTEGPMTQEEKEENVLFVFQIPLEERRIDLSSRVMSFQCDNQNKSKGSVEKSLGQSKSRSYRGMDHAQLSVGESTGVWDDNKEVSSIKRDVNYPIRCTIQYYRVTDTNEVPRETITEISDQVWKFYNHAPQSEKGSLVTDGKSNRKTEANLPERPVTGERFFGF